MYLVYLLCIRQESPILHGIHVSCTISKRFQSAKSRPKHYISTSFKWGACSLHVEKVAAWDIAVVVDEFSLCAVSKDQSATPPSLSPMSPPSHLPWPHVLYSSCGKSNRPANLLSAGQLAAWARTRSARTFQLYVYCCLSICSICHMPVPEVSWGEDTSEMKLSHQHESVPSHFLTLLLWTFLLAIYSLLPSSML